MDPEKALELKRLHTVELSQESGVVIEAQISFGFKDLMLSRLFQEHIDIWDTWILWDTGTLCIAIIGVIKS